MQDESLDAVGAPISSNETNGESQDIDDNDDNAIISWQILLSVIGGLFVIILIFMFVFICFRWKIENKPRDLQGQNAPSNGSFVEKLYTS